MKKPSLLLGWLLLATPVAVQAQFNYTITNGTVTITGYTSTNGLVIIPDTISGFPVTAIGNEAFFGHIGVTSVTIPSSVTNIGDNAFGECSMPDIAIPNSVISIGSGAFAGCSSLTNVTIPNSVTSIGDGPFNNCSGLTNIVVGTLNPGFSSVDGVLFNQSQTTLVQYPSGKVGSYMIPNNVTSIGVSAFAVCTGLTNITIPNSVTSIGDAAFFRCYNLTKVTIPDRVTNIANAAFESCYSLTSVYFHGNAPNVGEDSFLSDPATIYYMPGTAGWGPTLVGLPTALWTLSYPLILNNSLGVQSNQFGFTVSWATNASVVIEATAELRNPKWSPVLTNALNNGVANFADPDRANYPSRFYRVRSQ